MKTIERSKVSKLEDIPNIGKAIAAMLQLVEISHPRDLIGKNAYQLHTKLCKVKNKRIDNCVIDTFLSAISYMEGNPAKPWYHFTTERKKHLAETEGTN